MSQVNHITNVRPGDRWDGVALNIHKTSFDWSQAQVTVQLRHGARGPLVANVAFSQSTAVDTLVLGFYLTASDTAKLKLGSTYFGTVTVQIPNANPALEPTFGPYTLFTWAMEMSDRAQSGSATFRVEFGSATVFNITLHEGSTITISGGDGGGGGGAPSAHAATHRHGGTDEVATGTPGANAIPKADGNGRLDAWVSSGAAAGTPSLRALGTGALQACAGNDGRLSDARTPVAHTHPVGEVTGLGGAATLNVGTGPGTVCAGNDGRLSDSRTPTAHAASHRHGGADEVAVATPAANAIPKADGAGKLDAWITSSGAAATPSLRILGTAATDACAGNDARLSNARTPTAHTHTASDVNDFSEAVDDRVSALLVAGSNITITYNDASNTLTIDASGGGSGSVATDVIFDVKGDIPVGTGSNASARLPAGKRRSVLQPDPSEATGLKWVPWNFGFPMGRQAWGQRQIVANSFKELGIAFVETSTSSSYTVRTATTPNYRALLTATTINTDATIGINAFNDNPLYGKYIAVGGIACLSGTTNVRVYLGMNSSGTGAVSSDLAPAHSMTFRFSTSAGDTTWEAVVRDGSTENIGNTGVVPDTNHFEWLIEHDVDAGEVRFWFNRALVFTHTTNLPVAGNNAFLCVGARTLTAAAYAFRYSDIFIFYDRV